MTKVFRAIILLPETIKVFLREKEMPIQLAELKLYDLNELPQSLKVNKVTLTSYIEQGRLKAVKIGRSYRVTEEDLREFLLKRGRNLSKEEGIELKEIPRGHLGEAKEEALTRESLYEEYLEHKMGNDQLN